MNGLTVLLVDDEVELLELMSNRLRKRNIQVETATGGMGALALLEATTVDAVILDVKMPGMDGIETLDRIKAKWPQLPVILLTGHADMRIADQGLGKGAADYILKPTTIGDLIFKLHELCELEAPDTD